MSCEKRCQYYPDDGKPCPNILIGRGPRKFCSKCREAARKQAKTRSNQAYYASLRKPGYEASLEDHREVNRRCRNRCYHHLTKPKLRAFFDHADAQPEYDLSLKYEGYEYALTKLNEIKYLILNPPADLPSAAHIAHNIAEQLLDYLLDKKRDAPGDSTIDQLIPTVRLFSQ